VRARDLDAMANIFSSVYQQGRDIAGALRVVFAIDDARRGDTGTGQQQLLADADRDPLPRPLKQDKLSRYRQAQLLLPFIEEVAQRHGLTAKDLAGGARVKVVSSVRYEAMWFARAKTKASLPTIGMALGGRDHTTVLAGIRKFEARLATEPELRARVLGEARAA